ncbi:MAG: pseudaminic acid synthase [Deltaproteobacteria bacterium]|nr:pseudaminic acid synthase [Deltaproteobacteria bacterium]
MKKDFIEIASRKIGTDKPVFVIAEMSANHNQVFDEAVKIIHAANECGADAIKLQTYTPDTMTINSDNEYFKIKGTVWEGETLYNLYKKAYTPLDWQPKLKEIADEIGIILFSTPFDKSSVDFLEEMDVPAYKIASFELVDIPLIEYIASKGKPIIMSTGMATLCEISEAVETAKKAGAKEIALLKCTSAYPALPEEMNLRTIPHIAETFGVVAGLSDHTLGIAVSVASVALGACIIEKHLTLSRTNVGPDSAFSLEPNELKAMVEAVRTVEKAIGTVNYRVTEKEVESRVFRRSLFVVKDMKAGEVFTEENVCSIRPGYGLAPKYLKYILKRKATIDINRGTPLSWDLVGNK